MTAIEAQLRDRLFRNWLLDKFEHGVNMPAAFVRPDDFFDVAAYEGWLEDRYREWKRLR